MDFNGIMPRTELAAFRNPSVAGLFESVVGRWGNTFISISLLISVLGAYLAWTLFAAEVPFMAAKDVIKPTFLNRENAQKVPSVSLWMTKYYRPDILDFDPVCPKCDRPGHYC